MNAKRSWYRALMRRRIIAEGVWVSIGQGLAALGVLAGTRLLTEFLPPAIFGSVSLLLGVGALIFSMFCMPFLQAMLRYYPEYTAVNNVAILRRATNTGLRKSAALGILLLLGAGSVYSTTQRSDLVATLLLAALVMIDIVRSQEMAFYNAARRQKPYALWVVAEAWTRPLLAALAVYYFGLAAEVVLAAYLTASLILFAIVTSMVGREGTNDRHTIDGSAHGLQDTLLRYALPLMPLAILDWISGMGDRYIIGGFIGLREAGIYAATYGLVSRPFMMVGQVIELTLRPHYQNAVARCDASHAERILKAWKALLVTTLMIGLVVVVLWHNQIAWLLLGEDYRSGAGLMPWISAGYCLLVLSQFYERLCYAHSKTHYVLVTHMFSGIAGLAASIIAVVNWGLLGAAVAVPVYFGIQLFISSLLASRVMAAIRG